VGISRHTGLPCSIMNGDVELLHEPFEPSLWRPLNDNELGSRAQYSTAAAPQIHAQPTPLMVNPHP